MIKLYQKTFNNVVNASGVETSELKTVELSNINYNTYLMLTPLFKALIISTNNNGKYSLKANDDNMGFYFNYNELNLNIKVPLTAIFGTNDKLKGILAIKWSSATHCPSRALGLCQLPDTELCYAHAGEKQGSKKPANYLYGMGSYLNSLLCIYYWNLFYNDMEGIIKNTFFKYCNYYNIDTLRFNLSGDFKGVEDIENLKILASKGLKLTGYTARDDLRIELFKTINQYDNIILNGSNIMYNNRFKATDNIKNFFEAKNQCKGGCLSNGCLNCYKLKNELITVLIHGSRAGTNLNTHDNRVFITEVLNASGVQITIEDLKQSKDIFRCIKKYYRDNNLFKSVPEVFKKLNKDGVEVFDGHNGFINYLRVLFKKYEGVL